MLAIFFFCFWFVLFCLLISSKPLLRRVRNRPWWVEVKTEAPECIYYFGPFESLQESVDNQPGYLEDLQAENAKVVTVEIKQCQPPQLTICEETALS